MWTPSNYSAFFFSSREARLVLKWRKASRVRGGYLSKRCDFGTRFCQILGRFRFRSVPRFSQFVSRPGPSKVKKEPENRHLLGCFGLQKVDFWKITPKSAIFDGEMRSKSGQFYVTLGQVPFLDPSNRWFLGVKWGLKRVIFGIISDHGNPSRDRFARRFVLGLHLLSLLTQLLGSERSSGLMIPTKFRKLYIF